MVSLGAVRAAAESKWFRVGTPIGLPPRYETFRTSSRVTDWPVINPYIQHPLAPVEPSTTLVLSPLWAGAISLHSGLPLDFGRLVHRPSATLRSATRGALRRAGRGGG
jgi:hypothetical protein